ncbi:alpha/beta hydrolase [Aetokthonos hydrillicola Thurmond2011]|uniref:Alpha/beta hydrolase n=1 Tax=Aetokthonos hydrillicola Thurmond2011 TaxID=2712845 RepID=A0AAP5ID47_9CYAN|nr:alpha/beta hydrolase [Aetokthonos hydrillicola]MBO3462732.1 alpha/beta hydrolase [Aetokthonos hydrillicola CCALA 1050]MBW4585738.1 alpha/beta hydrolase [Aetokthonos hydrillicola CCALA 1050]MDR9899242.1 alpha/beta hydrolase [Aetokthonos hydrillicola Thurmond2011]
MVYLLTKISILILLLLSVGVLYGAIATTSDQYKYSPPGKLVDVGGYKLHIYCSGERTDDRSPTVVMDFGLAGWSLTWSLVQPEVAKFARVCTYDRAGYAWSDPAPTPRTIQQIVLELHTLLTNAGIESPYILVGHSFSGLTARLFANQYPNEVAGIVLVDAINEDIYSRPFFEFQTMMAQTLQKFRLLSITSRLGILNLLIKLVGAKAAPDFVKKLPSQIQPQILAKFVSKTFDAASAETASLEKNAAQLTSIASLNNIPLTVLSHGIPDMFSHLPANTAENSERIWQELQADLATLSSTSRLIIAEQSGHFIPIDQPDLVINAIRQMVKAVQYQ